MSPQPPAEIDPTRSQSKRDAFAREFAGRWQEARAAVRQLIEGDRHYRPQSRAAQSEQVADFREWLANELRLTVTDETPHRAVRKGRHYTAPYVRELYRHGIKRADQGLDAIGFEYSAPKPEAAIRYDPHKDQLATLYVEVYQDVEDAVHDTVKESTRAYRDAVRAGDGTQDTIARLNGRDDPRGRLRAIGENRTDLIAKSKAVVIINTAALYRYQQVGMEQVGVQVEAVPDDARVEAASAFRGCAHTTDALQPPGGNDTQADVDDDESSPFDVGETPDREGADPSDPEPAPGQDAGAFDQKHEWVTTGDDRVCDICSGWDGDDFWIEDVIRGEAPMPVRNTHPNCRCFLQPTPIFRQGPGAF